MFCREIFCSCLIFKVASSLVVNNGCHRPSLGWLANPLKHDRFKRSDRTDYGLSVSIWMSRNKQEMSEIYFFKKDRPARFYRDYLLIFFNRVKSLIKINQRNLNKFNNFQSQSSRKYPCRTLAVFVYGLQRVNSLSLGEFLSATWSCYQFTPSPPQRHKLRRVSWDLLIDFFVLPERDRICCQLDCDRKILNLVRFLWLIMLGFLTLPKGMKCFTLNVE